MAAVKKKKWLVRVPGAKPLRCIDTRDWSHIDPAVLAKTPMVRFSIVFHIALDCVNRLKVVPPIPREPAHPANRSKAAPSAKRSDAGFSSYFRSLSARQLCLLFRMDRPRLIFVGVVYEPVQHGISRWRSR